MHPDVALSIHNLAFAIDGLGRHSEAEELLRETLEMRRRLYPDGHQNLANSISNVGYNLHSQGKIAEAVPYFKEALEMFKRVYRADHPQIEGSLLNLAATMDDAGMSAQAEPHWREVVERRTARLPIDDYRLANARSRHGHALAALGRFAEAEPILLAAFATLQTNAKTPRGKDDDWLLKAADRVVALYSAWNEAAPEADRAEQANRWEQEVARLRGP
jgi:tetratricopeptide (TPR) repeat protein